MNTTCSIAKLNQKHKDALNAYMHDILDGAVWGIDLADALLRVHCASTYLSALVDSSILEESDKENILHYYKGGKDL